MYRDGDGRRVIDLVYPTTSRIRCPPPSFIFHPPFCHCSWFLVHRSWFIVPGSCHGDIDGPIDCDA